MKPLLLGFQVWMVGKEGRRTHFGLFHNPRVCRVLEVISMESVEKLFGRLLQNKMKFYRRPQQEGPLSCPENQMAM